MNILKGLCLLLILISVNPSPIGYFKDMVFVGGGAFVVGNNTDEEEGYSRRMFRDKPAHRVTVGDFYISRCEVTQDLFEQIMGKNPSRFKGARRPVEGVTWYEAVEFCNRLSERDGLSQCYRIAGVDVNCDFSANGYRLLTEAEWEYAARGGDQSQEDYLYAGSNDADEVAWNSNNSNGETHDVGQKLQNELGVYDLSGNVSEWCWDWFAEYSSEEMEFPTGPSNGTTRVERGGNWRFSEIIGKNTRRHFVPPDKSYHRLGFRIGRSK